ncbi:Hypothetical predicted protein [Cloeon dipterum]|uniref:Small monomeric GTPase n=1 Tax=Cloeon dipterum TaxID=197152 RepID=A0A8S1C6W5_9INSE|nr:Hypothetical predicted protein [Cloeon dipterum]
MMCKLSMQGWRELARSRVGGCDTPRLQPTESRAHSLLPAAKTGVCGACAVLQDGTEARREGRRAGRRWGRELPGPLGCLVLARPPHSLAVDGPCEQGHQCGLADSSRTSSRMPTMAPPGSTRSIRQFKRRFSLQPSSFLGRDDGSSTPRGGHSPSIDECSAAKDIVTKHRHKIVVMGPTKSGKTSLISQFLYGSFPDRYKRTVEEMHHGEFDVAGVRLTLDILDTSGAQEFPAMRALSISSADAFILVYALDESEESFEEVRQLRDLILSTKGVSAVPIVVIGNKLDLVEDKESQVERETVESIVTLDWEHGYVQASAKDNKNVAKCFQVSHTHFKGLKVGGELINDCPFFTG